MAENVKEARSLALTPTWSVATVLTIFVAVSLLVERSINRLSNWLRKTNRKPLLEALEKMKEELMLLGFISLLLTATSGMIANICIPSKFYNSAFAPCSRSEIDKEIEENGSEERLEQLHRFIFVMAITHVSYSCLTMLLAIVKNHNLSSKYDFHSYMVRSMEEEFQRIVGVSGPLWGFVVGFMLFNIKGSNLYFWIAIIPISLVLLVGTKLQQVIATLALENAGIIGLFSEAKLRPRDELFWFKKPELLLSLIHFILFQNAFELASFFWFWVLPYPWFAGQFLCSYSTLPLYALVTQMGTNYKAALIPQRIRETIHGWGKAARKKRRHGMFADDSTVHTDTSTVLSIEEDDHQIIDDSHHDINTGTEVELQPVISTPSPPIANETSSRAVTPLLRPSASLSSSSVPFNSRQEEPISRTFSMPSGR
ncbi:MLO-like protein 11-like [Trifolium pratense]|uniref:MLO-like protein n=1 Tax=Trifolium pratense TaxID=57577 RepID=A0A2K3MTH0_TRIPR|nr:MLO-like protein 11-like [Trifolium pratense]PNY14596.1 MLO-like protein 11-like [Trifolium pratense]